MTRPLWPHQTEGLEALRQTVGNGVKRIVLSAPTGSGKTLLSAAIIEGALAKGKRLAFVVSNLSLIDQSIEAFYEEGIRDISILQGNHFMQDWSKPLQIASIQTLSSRQAYPKADIVIIDECLAKGTKVSTPEGDRNIEDLRIGDCVFNAIGVGVIKQVSSRRKPVLKIRLSNGKELKITENHPLFTSRGWEKAASLEKHSHIFSQQALSNLWKGIFPEGGSNRETMARADILFGGVREYQGRIVEAIGDFPGSERVSIVSSDIHTMDSRKGNARAKIMGRARMLLSVLCEEIQESDAFGFQSSESKRYIEENWSSTECGGRQWEIAYRSASSSVENIRRRLEAGICNSDEDAARFWLSNLLQAGHREFSEKDWYRSRRRNAQFGENEEYRSEKNEILGDIRVEDISREECGSDQDVFNLHISGHPSYFADGVLVHNCHVLHEFHKKWMTDPEWQNVPFIGLSATPGTRGLGKYFQTLLTISTTQELIEKGFLSPFKVYATGNPDLSDVKIVAGDYKENELSEAMQKGELTADIVRTWQEKWGKDKTLCYAVDCAHAQSIQERFMHAGISAGYQDARTLPDERREIKRKFHNGEYRVVCNVGTLTTGTDWNCHCLILARPTHSKMLFQQIIGRCLRTADEKPFATVLDHTGTTQRLGFVTEIFWDHLDDGKPAKKSAIEAKEALPKECKNCAFLKPLKTKICPNCGHETKIRSEIMEADGELVELVPGLKVKGRKHEFTEPERKVFFQELKQYALTKAYKPGWAALKYKDKFGAWPPFSWNDLPAKPYSPAIEMWVRSRNIAWAKSKRNPAVAAADAK